MSVCPNGKMLACFTHDGFVWVITTDFSKNLSEFPTKSQVPPLLCCSVIECVAVGLLCCSVMKCVAVGLLCCSVMKCVAVGLLCCSVIKCVAV